MEKLNNAIKILKEQNFLVFTFTMWILYSAFHLVFKVLYEFSFKEFDVLFKTSSPNAFVAENNLYVTILMVVILGPLIETFFFQKLLFILLNQIKWFSKNKLAIIIIGALLFGLLHFFSLSYIVFNIFAGIFLMFTYIIRSGKMPYLTTFALHALNNITALAIIKFFDT